jgi:hypothetical protein
VGTYLFANPLFSNGPCIFVYLAVVAQQGIYMLQYISLSLQRQSEAVSKTLCVKDMKNAISLNCMDITHRASDTGCLCYQTCPRMGNISRQFQRLKLALCNDRPSGSPFSDTFNEGKRSSSWNVCRKETKMMNNAQQIKMHGSKRSSKHSQIVKKKK